ncbi:MAG: hypothetical protein ACPL7M_13500 [Bryobacteraceae bacterium]
MRYFFSRRIPPLRRVLLVESGSRRLIESLLPGIYSQPVNERVDLFTCFSGLPHGFDTGRGEVFRTQDYPGRAQRKKLYAMLRRRGYDVCGILCSDEAVMAKWKWALVWQVPAKVFIVNENCDYFWFDFSQWRTMLHFVLFRAGLTGGETVATLGRLIFVPFVLLYLLAFAAYVHLRRAIRT